jgi:hypothetical protein
MALSMGFKYSVSLLLAIQATGALALTLARLTLAEHASLGWTHDHIFNSLEFLISFVCGKILNPIIQALSIFLCARKSLSESRQNQDLIKSKSGIP